jgi:hypothetical protein
MFRDLEPDPRPPDEERRGEDRARLIVDLFFEGRDATGVAGTRDISASGLYMNTLAVLSEGTPLVLRIPLRNEQVVVNARVVYSNPGHGVGVHFSGLSWGERAALDCAGLETHKAA